MYIYIYMYQSNTGGVGFELLSFYKYVTPYLSVHAAADDEADNLPMVIPLIFRFVESIVNLVGSTTLEPTV